MRELVWLVIALLSAYVVFELYRSWRAGAAAPRDEPASAPEASAAKDAAGPGHARSVDEGPLFVLQPPEARVDASPPGEPMRPEGGFQSELEVQQLRREIAQLRAELAAQRDALASLEGTVRGMKEQLEANAAAQSISPEYNEALVFARRGLGVEAIAERCGISVAEADLVRSLARSGQAEGKEKS